MGRSDMIVQLSVWENCSYTLLDAKATGLKTVALPLWAATRRFWAPTSW